MLIMRLYQEIWRLVYYLLTCYLSSDPIYKFRHILCQVIPITRYIIQLLNQFYQDKDDALDEILFAEQWWIEASLIKEMKKKCEYVRQSGKSLYKCRPVFCSTMSHSLAFAWWSVTYRWNCQNQVFIIQDDKCSPQGRNFSA